MIHDHIDPTAAAVVAELLAELATEIDLHYDDSELNPDWKANKAMGRAAAFLVASGHQPPSEFRHIESRFAKARS